VRSEEEARRARERRRDLFELGEVLFLLQFVPRLRRLTLRERRRRSAVRVDVGRARSLLAVITAGNLPDVRNPRGGEAGEHDQRRWLLQLPPLRPPQRPHEGDT